MYRGVRVAGLRIAPHWICVVPALVSWPPTALIREVSKLRDSWRSIVGPLPSAAILLVELTQVTFVASDDVMIDLLVTDISVLSRGLRQERIYIADWRMSPRWSSPRGAAVQHQSKCRTAPPRAIETDQPTNDDNEERNSTRESTAYVEASIVHIIPPSKVDVNKRIQITQQNHNSHQNDIYMSRSFQGSLAETFPNTQWLFRSTSRYVGCVEM